MGAHDALHTPPIGRAIAVAGALDAGDHHFGLRADGRASDSAPAHARRATCRIGAAHAPDAGAATALRPIRASVSVLLAVFPLPALGSNAELTEIGSDKRAKAGRGQRADSEPARRCRGRESTGPTVKASGIHAVHRSWVDRGIVPRELGHRDAGPGLAFRLGVVGPGADQRRRNEGGLKSHRLLADAGGEGVDIDLRRRRQPRALHDRQQ